MKRVSAMYAIEEWSPELCDTCLEQAPKDMVFVQQIGRPRTLKGIKPTALRGEQMYKR